MTWDEVVALGVSFPGVEPGLSYGTPGLKVRGKLLTRLRPEDGSLVLLGVPFDERELLLEMDPDLFHLTDHYRGYPTVLVRTDRIDPVRLATFFERRWRMIAARRVVAAWDAARGQKGA